MDVENAIAAWKAEIAAKSHLSAGDVQELEDHLRDEMEELQKVGLAEDESFLIAVRRMGSSTALASELVLADSDKLWKQLARPDAPLRPENRSEVVWVVIGALIAAALGKLPLLYGIGMDGAGMAVYLRNSALITIPVLSAATTSHGVFRRSCPA